MNQTTVTAKLPHLDVEMTREEPGPGQPEVITMRLTATPSLDAFAEHLTNPAMIGPMGAFAAMNPMLNPQLNPMMAAMTNPAANPMMAPMLAWQKMMQDAWAPFMPAAKTLDHDDG